MITGIVLTIGNQRIVRIPEPNSLCLQLLSRINVALPEILPLGLTNHYDDRLNAEEELEKCLERPIIQKLF